MQIILRNNPARLGDLLSPEWVEETRNLEPGEVVPPGWRALTAEEYEAHCAQKRARFLRRVRAAQAGRLAAWAALGASLSGGAFYLWG